MQAFQLFLPLLLALPFQPFARTLDTKTAPKAVAVVPALKHVAVIGASVSAGIGLDPAADAFAGQQSKVQLAEIVNASILAPHDVPYNGADFNFFSSAEPIAKRSAAAAKAAKPTALVAIDYMFWLGYGPGSDSSRAGRVDTGLKLLEVFTCPVLVGDLPDFHGAGTNPLYLPKSSIPPSEVLSAMNKRIYAWAKEHKNVVVVPMAEMLRKVIADEEFTVGGTTYGKGSKSRLMQADNLHTTLEGTCGLWALAVEAWRAADPMLPAEAIAIDVPALAKKVAAAAAAAPAPKGKGEKSKPGAKKAPTQKVERIPAGG